MPLQREMKHKCNNDKIMSNVWGSASGFGLLHLSCWQWQWGPDAWTARRVLLSVSLNASCPSAAEEPDSSSVIHTWQGTSLRVSSHTEVKGKCNNVPFHINVERKRGNHFCHQHWPEDWFHKHPQRFQVNPSNKHPTEIHLQPTHKDSLGRGMLIYNILQHTHKSKCSIESIHDVWLTFCSFLWTLSCFISCCFLSSSSKWYSRTMNLCGS